MTTWTCKTSIAAVALLVLAACEGSQATDLIGGLSSINAKPNGDALAQAPMAFGVVTLVPPTGYCIDGESLRPRFALLARCDKLGAEGGGGGAPIGVMTVSVAQARGVGTLPTPTQTAAAFGLRDVSDPVASDTSVIFRAVGNAFGPDMSPDHWRGSALVNGQVIGVALYGRAGSAVVAREGRALVAELIKRTEESTD